MFGAAGTGKSILATQMAEGIARGRGVEGFRTTATRQKVLYVDLKLSDGRFKQRYSLRWQKTYRFSENLTRECPPSTDPDAFTAWLREMIESGFIRTVIIDDLAAFRTTCDGTRETLQVMRDLKRIVNELGVSILVLTGSAEPRRRSFASESDLGRSRVLCDVADAAFAIGRHPNASDTRYLIQLRSFRKRVWTADNAPLGVIGRGDDGLLGFTFDRRFLPDVDEETRRLICNIKQLRDKKASFRRIEETLGISRSKAARLLKKWRPEFDAPDGNPVVTPDSPEGGSLSVVEGSSDGHSAVVANADELDEWDECDFEKPDWLDDIETATVMERAPDPIHEAAPETPRSVLLAAGCRLMLNEYGKEMFVEHDDGHGNPLIWYAFDSNDRITRWEYWGCGRSGDKVDGPVCWYNTHYPLRG